MHSAFVSAPNAARDWEDADERRRRKRAEGLERSQAVKQSTATPQKTEEMPDMGILENT